MDRKAQARQTIDAYSPRLFGLFTTYLERYFARKFNAVRLMPPAPDAVLEGRATIFFSNHTAWWDPILLMLLAARFTPGRRAFGPIDAQALKKYSFMRRIGLFPVERDQQRGAAQFLFTARAIIEHPRADLWLTPQGEFHDVRDRPVTFKPGLGHLARDGKAVFVPVALEFVFWEESKPEALVAFGAPVDTSQAGPETAENWTMQLEHRLAETMDRLAIAARARNPQAFTTLVAGRARINPVYDGWRYLKALVRGERFNASHREE